VTDAVSHSTGTGGVLCQGASLGYGATGPAISGAHGKAAAISALQAKGIAVLGIASNQHGTGPCAPRVELEEIAAATGALVPPGAFTTPSGSRPAGCGADQCCTALNGAGRASRPDGLCPLVFDVSADGTGEFTGLIVSAIRALVKFALLDISAEPRGQLQPSAEAGLVDPRRFIKEISATALEPQPVGGVQIDAEGRTFLGVQPGATATFELAAENDFLEEAPVTQVFTLQIQVLGNGITTLDTRQVVIIIPARFENVIP
jgi:hypothetical protein